MNCHLHRFFHYLYMPKIEGNNYKQFFLFHYSLFNILQYWKKNTKKKKQFSVFGNF